ncbi:hypothetical protein B0H66DRAFT_605173 [Apodospora peruviana]|uniref:Uncharacterized protein n=1 Tax=Apodospora peruviana TaxID=516989 RepID=A0AAE0I274_9PEZI|nr:hypothetical protein B0H66DRAFT_605173 [Apodospora peruviana]
MSGPYTINVTNSSNSNQTFQIFASEPQYANGNPATGAFLNTWGTAPLVDPQGTVVFPITSNIYAVCGNGPAPLNPNVVITSVNPELATMTTPTQPGSDFKVDIPLKQAPIFVTSATTQSSTATNGFTINTMGAQWQVQDYPDRYCGVGRDAIVPGPGPAVVPVAVFAPGPNQIYNITPTPKFYILAGGNAQGVVADVTSLGLVAIIDFSNKTEATATVSLTNEGTWSPVEYSP